MSEIVQVSTLESEISTPTVTIPHRTITGLDGKYAPLPTDVSWEDNPNQESQKARFYCDIVVRGTTGLLDDPQLTFRPYVRNRDSLYVVAADSDLYIRPRLKDLTSIKYQKTVNIGVAYTDYSAAVVDNSATTQAELDALDTAANGDWVVVGGPVPFMGCAVDMDAANVNANASVLTAEYWNGAWVALANVVDGTIAVAGKTHSGDGQITWNMPADWVVSTINAIPAFWVRFSVSAALSVNVDVEECNLLMPIKVGIDVQVDGDDVMLLIESQDVVVTGTLGYSGTIRLSWR